MARRLRHHPWRAAQALKPYVCAPHGRFFAETIAIGSHAVSLRAAITDKADIAAIDAVSLALEVDEIRNAIKVIGWSAATRPALHHGDIVR